MKIAVTSKSGKEIDQHFGHAERFLIYEVTPDAIDLVSDVAVEKYCSYDPEHPFRHRQFDAIVDALEGCQAVVTAQIGPYPKDELMKRGITPFSASGTIGDALRTAFQQL